MRAIRGLSFDMNAAFMSLELSWNDMDAAWVRLFSGEYPGAGLVVRLVRAWACRVAPLTTAM